MLHFDLYYIYILFIATGTNNLREMQVHLYFSTLKRSDQMGGNTYCLKPVISMNQSYYIIEAEHGLKKCKLFACED